MRSARTKDNGRHRRKWWPHRVIIVRSFVFFCYRLIWIHSWQPDVSRMWHIILIYSHSSSNFLSQLLVYMTVLSMCDTHIASLYIVIKRLDGHTCFSWINQSNTVKAGRKRERQKGKCSKLSIRLQTHFDQSSIILCLSSPSSFVTEGMNEWHDVSSVFWSPFDSSSGLLCLTNDWNTTVKCLSTNC